MAEEKRLTRAEKRRQERENRKTQMKYGKMVLDVLCEQVSEGNTLMQQNDFQNSGVFLGGPFSEPQMTPQVAMDVSQTRMRAALQAEYDKKERDMRASYEDADRRMRKFYSAEAERVKKNCDKLLEMRTQHIQKKADEMAAAYERKCRREYDEHMQASKTSLKDEVIGDVYAKAVWVLHNNFKFTQEQLRKFLLESIRFDIFSAQPDNEISINDIVYKLKDEGLDLNRTIEETSDQVMDEEDERLCRTAEPHEGWTEQDDNRLYNGIVLGVSFERIGRWVAKSGGAVKMRAYRRWGTTSQDRIREMIKEQADAKKFGTLRRPDTGSGPESAAG